MGVNDIVIGKKSKINDVVFASTGRHFIILVMLCLIAALRGSKRHSNLPSLLL